MACFLSCACEEERIITEMRNVANTKRRQKQTVDD